jgi:hypothetical protein
MSYDKIFNGETNMIKRIFIGLILSLVLLSGCTFNDGIIYNEVYTSKDEVALYIHTYQELPPNYITKSEAYDLGWEPSQQNLWDVTDQKSIGGDRFMNREGLLPDNTYFEADIDYQGKGRNAKRLVYSDDGDIYYTDDHYASFQELY